MPAKGHIRRIESIRHLALEIAADEDPDEDSDPLVSVEARRIFRRTTSGSAA